MGQNVSPVDESVRFTATVDKVQTDMTSQSGNTYSIHWQPLLNSFSHTNTHTLCDTHTHTWRDEGITEAGGC